MSPRQKLLIGIVFLVPFFTLIHNLIALYSGCFHALDLGIYQQAILDLAFSKSWNPENTVRGIRIFGDHFDPIIVVAAFFQKLTGPNSWLPLVIEFLVFWMGGWFILIHKKNENFFWMVLCLMFWFFNEGISVALRYPVHPTTWSASAILILIYFFKNQRHRAAWIMLNFLCLFKEYFPFCLLMYGFFCFFDQRKKTSILVLLNAILWLFFDFYLRQRFFSEVSGYGTRMLVDLLDHPIAYLLQASKFFDWKGFIFAFIPLGFLFPALWKSGSDRRWLIASIFFITPILAIQFLFGNMRFQYGAPIFACFAAMLIWSEGKFNKRLIQLAFVFMVYAGGDVIAKGIIPFFPKEGKCRYSQVKLEQFQEAKVLISLLDIDKKVLVTGGLIPIFVKPNQQIYQLGGFSKRQDEYAVIAFGRNSTSDLFPYGAEEIEKKIQACRSQADRVLLDKTNIFLAEGRFTEDCLHQ